MARKLKCVFLRTPLSKSGPEHEAAYMQGMGTTAAWKDSTEWRAFRDHEFTYAIYHRDRKELLFNNRRDPLQLINLAEDRGQRALLEKCRKQSEKWRREQNDSFEACAWYQNRWTTNRNITRTAKSVGQDLKALQKLTAQWFPDGVGEKTT